MTTQHELTLIVAATRSLGIGRNGNMPWPPLRKEMQYFARVTSRTAPGVSFFFLFLFCCPFFCRPFLGLFVRLGWEGMLKYEG